jgi:hypothetical protein
VARDDASLVDVMEPLTPVFARRTAPVPSELSVLEDLHDASSLTARAKTSVS